MSKCQCQSKDRLGTGMAQKLLPWLTCLLAP